MIRNILNTFFVRSFNAGLAFLIVVLTARYFGAEIRGEISIFILNLSIVSLIVAVIGGSSLVYFSPHRDLVPLVISTIGWSLIAVPVSVFVLDYFGFVNPGYKYMLLVSAFILSWFMAGLNILLGFERIKSYNFISLLQMVVLAILFFAFYYYHVFSDFENWFYAYLISVSAGLLFVIILIYRKARNTKFYFAFDIFKIMFNYGKWTQAANFLQLLNYRLGYYFLLHFAGTVSVGIYSTAVAVAEGVWLITRSISMVVFARVVNLKDNHESALLAILYGRLSLYFSICFILLLFLFPDDFYTWLFGGEFIGIRYLLVLLSPGIVIFSLTNVYGHFFSGSGRPKINTSTSIIGLVVTLILGLWLIPEYGGIGVAITTSVSFMASGSFLIFKMLQEPGINFAMLLPEKSDISKTKKLVKSIFKK